MKPLSWHQLDYFHTAARLQHVSRAAQQLGISQPALSRALAKLEADLSLPLFDRVGRSIRLTRYGEIFQRRVGRALREIEEGCAELNELAIPGRGTVGLGFLRTLGISFVPHLVREFCASFPDVRFSFVQNNDIVLEESLVRGDIDLILNSTPLPAARFDWDLIAHQELVLIVPRSHRLARRRSVAMRELANEPFVCFKAGHAFRLQIEELCNAAGFLPKVRFEADDSSSMPGFVASGFGIAIVPAECAESDEVVTVRVTTPAPRRAIGIARIKDRHHSASARALHDFVRAQGASMLSA
jgi:DNA-binding transcriptional LysR family regulator